MSLTNLGSHGLQVEAVPLEDIAARFGTPCYVYSRLALTAAYLGYRHALQAHGLGDRTLVCYAVKANSNLAILNLFASLGAGFDIVSGGELARVLAAGGSADKIVFSGVGKSREEMRAALESGIHCFNVESASELEQLNEVAGSLRRRAPVSLRVNPDVDARTHPYISTGLKTAKFGVAFDQAFDTYRRAASMPHLAVTGIDCHIGSQLLDPAPAAEAADKVLGLVDRLAAAGVALDDIYVDPLVFPLATDSNSAMATLEAIREIAARYPGVHTICGLTNVSFGLPARKLVNRVFLAGAIAAGMDAVLIDPSDPQLMAMLFGAEAVFGRDEYCMNFIGAFDAGKLA